MPGGRMSSDLLLGSGICFLNFAIHAVMTGLIVVATRHTAAATDHLGVFLRLTSLLTITMVVLMCAHLVEIGVWALFYGWADIKVQKAGYFEFAFENYTALGYGDAVAVDGHRLIGPITA